MKNTHFQAILFSLSLFLFNGCEKATLQNEQTLQTTLLSRGNCNECPEDDECCCSVRLQATDNNANLLICGSTSGTSTCFKSGTTGCNGFSGISYSFTLTGSQVQKFCALISGPFWIKNVDISDPASIIITCQDGEFSPQVIQITLNAGDERYFENSGDCEIGPCS
jgi:hypothetical protein